MLHRARTMMAAALVAAAKAVLPHIPEREEPELEGSAPPATMSEKGLAMLETPKRVEKQKIVEGPLPGSVAHRLAMAKGRTL